MKAAVRWRRAGQACLLGIALATVSFGTEAARAVESNLNTAKSALQKSDFTTARLQSEIAIVSNPKNADAYVTLGQAHVGLERFSTALKFFTIALELRPDHRVALYHNGVVQARLGREEEAQKTLGRLARQCNKDCDEYRGLSAILSKKTQ